MKRLKVEKLKFKPAQGFSGILSPELHRTLNFIRRFKENILHCFKQLFHSFIDEAEVTTI